MYNERTDSRVHGPAARPKHNGSDEETAMSVSDLTTKQCRKCHQVKPLDSFSPKKTMRDGRRSWCKTCASEREKQVIPPTEFPTSKQCRTCGETKPIERFNKRYRTKDGRVGACKDCTNAYQREHNQIPKVRAKIRKKYRAIYIMQRYGMTLEEYEILLVSQGGVCAICGSESSGRDSAKHLDVDHDHDTGRVRGLLCHHCNVGMGHFKDDVNLMKAAIQYLERALAEK
jgi:hypothetical protein